MQSLRIAVGIVYMACIRTQDVILCYFPFSRNVEVSFRYFLWKFMERLIDIYTNTLFSVNIHGTLKYIFANFHEDSRNIEVGLHVRYFPWKFQQNIFRKYSVTVRSNLYCVLRSLVAVK